LYEISKNQGEISDGIPKTKKSPKMRNKTSNSNKKFTD
jgi:hypothetical protein